MLEQAFSPIFQPYSKNTFTDHYEKDRSQLKTEAPSQPFLKKKISLQCCSSSISIQQKKHFEKQRKLLSCYILATSQKQRQRIFLRMQKDYLTKLQIREQNYKQQQQQYDQSQTIHLNIVNYDGQNDLNTKVWNHYIGAWVISMGYEESSTMKYFLAKCYSLIGVSQLPLYERYYKNLGDRSLCKIERIQFLLNLCKNGWEYLFMGMLKHTKKQSHLVQKTNDLNINININMNNNNNLHQFY